MTHPNREELAGRLMFHGRYAHETEREAAIRRNAEREEAAAALRQSPSVEEVAELLRGLSYNAVGTFALYDDPDKRITAMQAICDQAAQAIAALYGRGGG